MSGRKKILQLFKNVHRARTQVFKGDMLSLTAARNRINEEFQKHKEEKDPDQITKLMHQADEAADYLRGMIVQAKLNEEKDIYEVTITKDTKLYKNIPYNEYWEPPKRRRRGKGEKTGCSDDSDVK